LRAAVEAFKNVGEHMGFLGAVNCCHDTLVHREFVTSNHGRGSEGCQP
jgi:hypothetical protein